MDANRPATARRQRVASEWAGSEACLLVAAGLPVPIAGTDQFHEFHPHPEFRYLAGVEVPAGVLAFDPRGGWTLFAPVPSEEERVWSGDSMALPSLSEESGIGEVVPLQRLQPWLEGRRGRPLALAGNSDLRERPEGYGGGRWTALEAVIDDGLCERVARTVAEARRSKDHEELDHMRAAAAASLEGHLTAMRIARPGMTERRLQVEMEAAFFRAGARRTAYGSIVGAGANAAVLHFSPGDRVLRDGELVLIDAAAEWEGYAADITRTFPAGRRFEGLQRDMYQLVLEVQEHAIAGVGPGVEYRELHLRAAHEIATGLRDLGILRGEPASLVERDAHAIFFPHGLGHLIGLSTHDAGGCLAGRRPSDRFGLKWLRADLPLREDYVVTIEPGIYFIRSLLTSPTWRQRYRDEVNWERVEGLLDFGGIRIEDDVRVTADGAEVLSGEVPKRMGEIEALRREAIGL